MTTTPAQPSWKNPKPLLKALTVWAARDDTRPDPAARAAADTALAAIADTIAELAALGLRLEREIAGSDQVHAEIAVDDDSGYRDAAELDHDEQIAIAAGGALTHTEAEDALTATGYSATEACRILLAVEQAGTYRDDTVTVTASPSRPMLPRYRITEPDGPLSGPQLAVVHSMAGLVHDEPAGIPDGVHVSVPLTAVPAAAQ